MSKQRSATGQNRIDVSDAVASAYDVHTEHVLASRDVRTRLLHGWAERLDDQAPSIVQLVGEETALLSARITGELARTTGQLRLFADVVDEGSWVDARIDTGQPDISRMLVPVGPVAVFGASNFPLAFSTPGGDTASALASGCPVVVKTHPAHPRTTALTAGLMHDLLNDLALPSGVFQVVDSGIETGLDLVRHPLTAAVAFTGSLGAGRAIADVAAARPRPIPVYAEMESTNPLFILPSAATTKTEAIAEGLADSLTLGVGQFCTKPGVVVAIGADELAAELGEKLAGRSPGVMLTPNIGERYVSGVEAVLGTDGVTCIAGTAAAGSPVCVLVEAEQFLTSPLLREEVFGPYTVVVSCRDEGQMLEVAGAFDGQLTATIHADPSDRALAANLVNVMVERVGRIVWNGYPTGVTVSHAMAHGGPYPASSDSRSTSVGSAAINRFVRPVAYQDVPTELLPAELLDQNPLGIWRMVNGVRTQVRIS